MNWIHQSSKSGELPVPPGSDQQTMLLVGDLDKDGHQEIIVGCRGKAPALAWIRPARKGWMVYTIEAEKIPIEAGGVLFDVDGDGDLDLIAGNDWQGNGLYWWENPYPHFSPDTPWKRHVIKAEGATQHHDQIVGDFDGDGKPELVFWNQGAKKLFHAPIPKDPRNGPWPYRAIWEGEGEGLAAADIILGQGRTTLLAGGKWFMPDGLGEGGHGGRVEFRAFTIDPAQHLPRIAVGDLNGDGKQEVVMVNGDAVGRLKWYERPADPTQPWIGHDLLGHDVIHGHSLIVAPFSSPSPVLGRGGRGVRAPLDIFCGEMAKWTESRPEPDNPHCKMWLFRGDGRGHFETTVIAEGFGVHETRAADIDGDGRLDLICKPYNWDTPRLDLWLNRG